MAFVLAEAQWTRSLPCNKSLRSRGNIRKRSTHVLFILKKHMIALLKTSFGRCCYIIWYWWSVTSSSCGCDVAWGSSITLNGWARIRQPPCQAFVHSEQTPNPIWMAVYGTRCYNMVCGLFLRTTFTGRR